MIREYINGTSTTRLSEKYEINTGNVYRFLKRHGIRKFRPGNRTNHPFKKPQKKLERNKHFAYILGVLCGDGYKNENVVGLHTSEKSFALKFKEEIEKFSGLNALFYERNLTREGRERPINGIKTRRKKKTYRVLLSGRKLSSFFKDIKTKTTEWEVPKFLFSSKKKIKENFLRGFADSEGSVGNRSICLCNRNKRGLREVKYLLDLVGLRKKNINLGKKKLNIYHKKNLLIFKKRIGFSLERKNRKLEDVLNEYKNLPEL